MYQKGKKLLAFLCTLAVVLTALPTVPAKAAAVPKFQKTYATLYENGTNKGKYNYTLKNLKKGQTVKWSVSGAGKAYVSVKKASKKATKSTMLNVLTVKTNKKTAAKQKKITLTAKIYSATGKWQSTVKTSAKIMIRPTKVTLSLADQQKDALRVGESYQITGSVTPVNATYKAAWTVTDEKGVDCSSYIDSNGVFQPTKAGTYKITMAAKIGTKTIKSASMTVSVITSMQSVKQTAAKKLVATYSGDMREKLKADDFLVKNAAGSKILVKELGFSEDGTKVTITLLSNLKDGVQYTVDDGDQTLSFTASVGAPAELRILTQKVTVDKATKIEYALYDKNGIDVTDVYTEAPAFQAQVMNGYLQDGDKLFMTEVGKDATVTATYRGKTESGLPLICTAMIGCAPAELSDRTNFTLTSSTTAPDFTAASYQDNRKAAIGQTYYVHFRALDTDGSVIPYTSFKYVSSDPDALIISEDGKVTPIRSGNVEVVITAMYAGEEYTYSYDVTIAEASYLKSLKLSRNQVTMSNANDSEYCEYVSVTTLDQYGEAFRLENETGSITDHNTSGQPQVAYDAVEDRMIITAPYATAGTYAYTLTLTADGKTASVDFIVTVVAVPTTGTETYRIWMDKNNVDLSLKSNLLSGDSVKAKLRLAQYRGNVFAGYAYFSTFVTITKGGYYYGPDLTAGGTTTKQTNPSSGDLDLTLMDFGTGICKKAETGTYTITMQFTSPSSSGNITLSANLTLTDTQDAPRIRVDRTKANVSCATALELAKNCLTPDSGEIKDCVVTGETRPGSEVSLNAGAQVNIRSVTVTGTYKLADREVSVTYTVPVGRTLTNL